MRILLTGGSGLLGKYLLERQPRGFEICSVNRAGEHHSGSAHVRRLDLTDFRGLQRLLTDFQPEGIIHTAAEGSVDKVEADPQRYYKVNTLLPEFLANFASYTHSRFVHISSNAVFGGESQVYSDCDELNPVNAYGRLKAEAEARVMTADPSAVIMRPILMFGLPNPGGRRNIAQNFIEELSHGRSVKALTDIVSQPLYGADAAEIVWDAFQSKLNGPVNVSGGETLSIYEFALLIADVFNLDPALIEPCRLADMDGLSKRPMRTVFTLTRLHEELSYKSRPVREGLERLRSEFQQSVEE